MSDELHKPGDWMKVLRRIRFADARDGVKGATIKAVATALASYADFADGTSIHPGTARVAVDCEIDYRTAKRCIAVLRDVGLIKLVRRATRRHLSDEYRLDIPAELLECEEIVLWDPVRYEEEIERLRVKHRGKYRPKGSPDDGLRGTESTAETGPEALGPDSSAGHADTRRTTSAGHAMPDLRGTQCPPTNQYTDHGYDQPLDGEDQSGNVLVPDSQDPDRVEVSAPIDLGTHPRCAHGRSTRRNADGRLRCPHCRADEEASAFDKCAHGVSTRYRCPACRRGLAGGEP